MTIGELARRIAVAVVGIPIVVGVVYAGHLPFAIFLGALGGLGAWELFRMARGTGIDPLEVVGIAIAAAIPLYVVLEQLGSLRNPASLAAVVFVALLGTTLWARGVEARPLAAVAVTALGAVYAGGLLSFAYLLRHHRFVVTDLGGSALVLFPVSLTWATDVGAYFVGRAIGKAKLMPSVSTGKTRAGAVGAILLSALGSVADVHFILRPTAQLLNCNSHGSHRVATLRRAVIDNHQGLVADLDGAAGHLPEG